mmetsp:Transcript_6655/g.14531  ORF Transcript_6655/g.14531 Transcript_6655/m.14531 type:complete len:268 (+) Transcript_6655:108-911(+)
MGCTQSHAAAFRQRIEMEDGSTIYQLTVRLKTAANGAIVCPSGLQVDIPEDSSRMIVRGVVAKSPLAQLLATSGLKICAGEIVVEVNGQGQPDRMLRELHWSRCLTIRFWRLCQPPRSPTVAAPAGILKAISKQSLSSAGSSLTSGSSPAANVTMSSPQSLEGSMRRCRFEDGEAYESDSTATGGTGASFSSSRFGSSMSPSTSRASGNAAFPSFRLYQSPGGSSMGAITSSSSCRVLPATPEESDVMTSPRFLAPTTKLPDGPLSL